MDLPVTSIPEKKSKKRRVIVDPSNLLPFEVPEDARVFYRDDEYKYLIHYARSFPTGQVPVFQYLMVRFHPLIIKTSGHYFSVLGMEWRDLISFTRQKFLELVYRFNLKSSLYFRTYIQTALRRAVYDKVLFEARRKELSKAVSLNHINRSDEELHQKELSVMPVNSEDSALVLSKILHFVEITDELTEEDRLIFKLRFIEHSTIEETKVLVKQPNFYIVARQRVIRAVLKKYAQEKLL